MENKIKNFWSFCAEREKIRSAKEKGQPRPWTNDSILHRHKFTNINRLHDRGTQLLIQLCKEYPAFDQFCAISIYRFSGSNNGLIDMMHKYKPDQWFSQIATVKPLFNMTAYQASWPAGQGKGVEFLKKIIDQFCQLSYKKFTKNMSIIQARDIMCDTLEYLNYKRMRFQTTEVAKDLSILTDLVDPNSKCPMNVGAVKGLIYIFNSTSSHNVNLLINHESNPGYNTQIIEHALCEYSKYLDYQTGKRKYKNKVYKPTEILYNNTTQEKTQ